MNFNSSLPTNQILSLLVLGALPIIFMSTTSYLKVSVILSILRSALGGGQIPSQALSGILSLIISLYTISPVLEMMYTKMNDEESQVNISQNKGLIAKVNTVSEPLIDFMRLNTQVKERVYFHKLDQNRKKTKDHESACSGLISIDLEKCLKLHESIASLLISYVSSELKVACTLGVYIFVPFLVIDLVVSTLLTGLGMMMVSPVTITLPLKLLVFVVSDGWKLLIENLITSYRLPLG